MESMALHLAKTDSTLEGKPNSPARSILYDLVSMAMMEKAISKQFVVELSDSMMH
jgi:hypothetical protein